MGFRPLCTPTPCPSMCTIKKQNESYQLHNTLVTQAQTIFDLHLIFDIHHEGESLSKKMKTCGAPWWPYRALEM